MILQLLLTFRQFQSFETLVIKILIASMGGPFKLGLGGKGGTIVTCCLLLSQALLQVCYEIQAVFKFVFMQSLKVDLDAYFSDSFGLLISFYDN